MKFRATLQLGGKTATGIEVPAAVVEALSAGKRPPVNVTIRDYTYRTTIAPMSGTFMIPVSAEVRGHAGVAAGDDLEVAVTLDTEPRDVDVPADLAAALQAHPAARRFFDQLSNSNKKWHVLQVTGAKTAQTRQRRIDKSVAMLDDGRAR